MNSIERKKCCITGEQDLKFLYEFHRVPVFMGCSESPSTDDLFERMSWSISESSGAIQLDTLIPLETLYLESHGSGDIGSLWNNHHCQFAEFINNFDPNSVFEIGGGHGRLAKIYEEYRDIPWTIIEPNPTPDSENKATFIEGFFDDKFRGENVYDTVIHSHLLEHVYDQDEFMKNLSKFMNAGDKLLFSLPNMKEMLKRNYTNCLNFEHTVFITEPYIEYLLAKHGFKVIKKNYFMDDHSIFYCAVRDKTIKPISLQVGLYEENRKIFFDFIEYHEELIRELNRELRASSTPMYLFGAHVFSQFLIQMGLDTSRLVCVLDNDRNKQGKRLYGTDLMVKSPKELVKVFEPKVILKAGVYNQEIRSDIVKNINKGAIFYE